MRIEHVIGAAGLILAAGLACGQPVQKVARTAANTQEFGQRATDNAISVGAQAIVITSNHGISLFDKAGTQLVAYKMSDSGFPFIRTETDPGGTQAPSRYFDGRTEYDHAHNRQWIMYSETNDEAESTADRDISSLHVAVNRNPAFFTNGGTLDNLSTGQWWYYTGPSSNPGNGGTAFDLNDDGMDRYYAGGPHDPFPEGDPSVPYEGAALVDLPTIAIDEQALYVTAFGRFVPDPPLPFVNFQNIFIIPIDFNEGGVSKSMLDGDKPPVGQIISLRLRDLPVDEVGQPPVKEHEPDFHLRHYAVQEPFAYTEAENAQLFVSISVDGSVEQTGIRVAGLWFDDTFGPDGEWIYTQHIVDDTGGDEDYPLAEVDVDMAGLAFFYSPDGYQIETPDPDFSPRPAGAFISSAVLAKDSQGELRLFIAHHANPSDNAMMDPQAEQRYAVQWYVIDPDLGTSPDNFRTIQDPPVWNPTLVESGRIETDGTDDGDCYNPSIGVNRQGEAYIEYSFTNDETWPEVRRVKLTTDYSAVDTNVLLQAGPVNYSYEDGLTVPIGDPNDAWQDFSDMQHDPFLCKLWSTHTLVHDPGVPAGTLDVGELRDLWLFENRYTTFCLFNPDMNGNSMVESGDALLYNNYYDAQDDRADADANGEVDVHDMLIFLDAYSAGTP